MVSCRLVEAEIRDRNAVLFPWDPPDKEFGPEASSGWGLGFPPGPTSTFSLSRGSSAMMIVSGLCFDSLTKIKQMIDAGCVR